MLFIRYLFIFLGSVSLVLGVIGIFLPVLPTTPFLLLTAFLYFKSSPRAYEWLITQPYLGKYIRNYRENRIVPLRAKIFSLIIMWTSISYCVFYLIKITWVNIVLVLISAAVTCHLLSLKSR